MSDYEGNNGTEFSEDFADIDRPKNTKVVIKRLIAVLGTQKKELILMLLTVIIGIGLFAITPLFLGRAIDELVADIKQRGFGGGFYRLFLLVGKPMILLLLAYILSSLLAYFQERYMAQFGELLILKIRKQVSEKITKLPLKYFDQHQTGELLSRVTNDLDKVSEVLKSGLLQFANSVLNIGISIIIMLTLSPLLTIMILATFSISILATRWISTKSFDAAMQNQAVLGEFNSKIEEYYTGNLIIKSFNQQNKVIETMKEINERQYQASKKSQFVIFAIYPLMRFVTQISFVVAAIVGGLFVVSGRITVGMAQAFLQYVNQISEPLTTASYFISSLQSALAALERVFELLDEPEEISEPENQIRTAAIIRQGMVEFKHVHFGYDENILMHDVSFTVKPNEMVAIVGPTGAGKTTLINLLMRFYELNGGQIAIDGIDISRLSKNELRRMVGMVLQDTWLFEGTIAENIAYGKKDATMAEIIKAAQDARCDHVIRTLKHGYDTVISSEESSLSQGEMQLLTIARAMLTDPALMILDEATSSVDTRTEVEVQKAMAKVMEGKTSFVIAHRLSTIRSADVILVMNKGDIVEYGSHQELLAMNGFYAELYASQFS